MSKKHNVVVEFRGAQTTCGERVANVADVWDTVYFVSPRTGKKIWLSGSWEGDTCMDIRNQVAAATKMGMSKASIGFTSDELNRIFDAHNRMIEEYDPSR